MNLFAYMVTRNETERYLAEVLGEFIPFVDGLLVYDDRSDRPDVLHALCAEHKNVVLWTRPLEGFSFVENEALFREDAWRLMEKTFKPVFGDWILTIDADEFLRAPYPDYVKELCASVDRGGYNGLSFHVHEVWTEITGPPEIRVDGFWGQISALRACQWLPNGRFKEVKMGGGSLPEYVSNIFYSEEIDILHYGYARSKDREAKFSRYNARRGHNPKHISSIMEAPSLAPLPPVRYTR